MATASKAKPAGPTEPRHPEKKFGPFHGGCGLAIWLNEVKTDNGPRYFRSVTVQPRRYRDRKTGKWKDAVSLRPSDLPALILAMEAAQQFIAVTPLPGQAAEVDDAEALADGEVPNGQPVQ
jgi:hypothetical protein